jgi:hypothetical protein
VAAKKKEAAPEVHPSLVAIHKVDPKAFAGAMQWADKERRSTAATNEAERALSVLVQTAAEIASQAGDIPTDTHSGTPIERERAARRIQRLNETLSKVRTSVAELASA